MGDTVALINGVGVVSPETLEKALKAAGSTAKLRVLNVRNQQYVELQVEFE